MFCSKCGTKMEEGAKFCPSCGTATGAAPAAAPMAGGPKKLHCPQCGSHNIAVTTESSVNGAVTSHHGAFSSTHVSNTHRNFWMCADCGTKFRSIPSLEEEIKKTKSQPLIWAIFTAIALILTIYFFANSDGLFTSFMFKAYGIASLICTILFGIFIFVSKNKLTKLRAELAYLQYHCFK